MIFERIEHFVRIATAADPQFASNHRLVFLSNRDGLPHAHLLDRAREQITDLTPDAGVVYELAIRPHRNELLYVTDIGGDEQYQIHLLEIDSGRTRPLAAAPNVIHKFGAWSPDGRFVSYASNERDVRFFDVYVLDVDRQDSHCVLRDDAMNAAGLFAADGRSLMFSRPNLDVPGDNDLFCIALAEDGSPAAAPLRLTEHDHPTQWHALHVYTDGTVLALSDEDREFVGLQRIDGSSGERRFLLTYDWDVEGAAVSAQGRHVAIVVNEDGYSRLEAFAIGTNATLDERIVLPGSPPGVVGTPHWQMDGAALTFAFESATEPPEIRVLEVVGRSVSHSPAPASGERAAMPRTATLPEPDTVRYPSFDGTEIPAYFYRPRVGDPPWPCLVLVHGGPEAQSRPALWRRYPAPLWLLTRGVALLVPNVRGSTGYGKTYEHADDREKRMDAVRDLLAAAHWLEAGHEVDPGRIGVMGASYGGFMVLAAITEAPNRWAAAIDLYGVVNFETLLRHTGPWRRRHRAREYGEDPALLRRISPIHAADRIRAPLLVAQGDRDVRVPQEESEQIVAAVRANGGAVEYVVYPNEGHGIEQISHRLDLAERIVAFCAEHLRVPI